MKTKTALCLTILVMLLCAMNMVMVWQLTHVKESSTVEMTATVTDVDCKVGLVYVKPDNTLYLPNVMKSDLSPEAMESLVGQKAHFRMKESTAQFFTHEQYGEILSLSTDERDIFTLEDYNRAMQADNAQGWPVWFMIEGGLLVLLLYFTWKLAPVLFLSKREKTHDSGRTAAQPRHVLLKRFLLFGGGSTAKR